MTSITSGFAVDENSVEDVLHASLVVMSLSVVGEDASILISCGSVTISAAVEVDGELVEEDSKISGASVVTMSMTSSVVDDERTSFDVVVESIELTGSVNDLTDEVIEGRAVVKSSN